MNAFTGPALLSVLGLIGVRTHMKVITLNPKTGRFPTRQKATVVTSVATDLDQCNSLLLMPDNEFVRGQVGNIRYFEDIMTLDQLESALIKNGSTDQVPSIQDDAGVHQACMAYKPFLWLQFKTREVGDRVFAQFVLSRPNDAEALFLVERELEGQVAGVNDQNTWYPLFNALVAYIDANSRTWSAKQAVQKISREPIASPVSDLSLLVR